MKKLIVILAIISLAFSATVHVYDVAYEQEFEEPEIKQGQTTYFRLPHDGRRDNVFIQYRVPKGSYVQFSIQYCLYAARPTDEQIINEVNWYQTTPNAFNIQDYDYYRFSLEAVERTYFIGIRVTYNFIGNKVPYYFHSDRLFADLDSMTRVVYANARELSDTTKLAMAYIIMNRYEKRQSSIYDEATRNGQCFDYFVGTMEASAQKACENAAKAAMTKSYRDPTNGATHFYKGYNTPGWAMGRKPIAEFEGIKYFNNIYTYN